VRFWGIGFNNMRSVTRHQYMRSVTRHQYMRSVTRHLQCFKLIIFVTTSGLQCLLRKLREQ
jgi:hypothetical protein